MNGAARPATKARGQDAHACGPQPTTAGYKDGKAILADAFRRMVAAIQLDHAINGSYDGMPVLAGVNVSVRSPNDELNRESPICPN
ncbi:hypothetical protein ZWY2020_010358 [Hordeum vulgare]|nr:hypothetical protein ZWY2020_010358 [Hordeum vulgare]